MDTNKQPLKLNQSNVNQQRRSIWIIDYLIAGICLILLTPVISINYLIALVTRHPVYCYENKIDALGRDVKVRSFSFGIFKKSARLISVLKGELSLGGVSYSHSLDLADQSYILNNFYAPTGLISLYDIRTNIGLHVESPRELLVSQLQLSARNYLGLLVKGVIYIGFYNSKPVVKKPSNVIKLFGLNINNVTMSEAINWVTYGNKFDEFGLSTHSNSGPNVAFFVNAHSVNLSASTSKFYNMLNQANCLFADGSGMRLAAQSKNQFLRANVNGTDMLPKLCKHAAKSGSSLYFLGGSGDIAKRAAKNLEKRYSGLTIAGTHHGFIDQTSESSIIKTINESNVDILLVGMGSPIQESWILSNKDKLNVKTILAVGGLFDYFSGHIPRAPMWMREIGMEWIWRLMQEPVKKFKRYAIGTPEFLIRTFILKQA